MKIKQISPKRFPSGDSYPLAMLKYDPDELSALYHLNFEEDYDDLDYFLFAALENSQIGQVVLLKYKNNAVKGTDVIVDSAVSVTEGLQAIQDALELKSDDVIWINPR
jgi:hypothetical protein